ncbi:flagellar filament capping protein FliD [Paenibacillus durus]|uniref:Flagellar hook-associated protein 2 n=1 Tax=Paenibacillus durus ATCC 35681 TaxID=1333534 RepID=A0A0F7CJV4_PAEDU|nr:flagellar filament capping protein FliD [Paenibacillus durus]AKG36566.1 hypothetical protein VK70_20215 [Paenibacillus durus ATCC 35681]
MGVSISGLASGFDSAAYIKAVMNQEKVPVTKLETKKENVTKYQGLFNTLKTKVSALKDAAFSLSDISAFKVNSATSSDTTKLTVTAGDTALAGDYSLNVTSLAKASVYQSKASTAMSGLAGEKIQLKISTTEVKEITLTGATVDEILTNLAKDINRESGAGMTASIVQSGPGEKRLVLTSKETGTENAISFMDPLATNADGSLTAASVTALESTDSHPVITMSSTLKAALGYDLPDAEAQQAADAKMTINGVDVTSSSNKVESAIPGVTLQLTDIGSSTVKVSQDADKISDKVDAFVKAYNDVVTIIRNNTKKSEKNSDGSLSLTLMGDPMLRDLQSQLNDWMNTLVGSSNGFKLLSDAGLEVDKGVTSATLMTGTITFDKDQFKAKLAENSDMLSKMFTGSIAKGDANDGLGTLFTNNLKVWTDSVNGLITSKIKGYDSEISFLGDQINSMNDRLAMKEQQLQRQYTNLEVVMSQLNSQKTWMTSQFQALTKSSS